MRAQVNDVRGKANVGHASFLAVSPDHRPVHVQINDNEACYQEDPSLTVGRSCDCAGIVFAVWQDFRSKKSYDAHVARSLDGGKSCPKTRRSPTISVKTR